MSVDKMEEDIKELSRSECIPYNKPFVFPARFSDGHRCRFCNDHMRPVSYVRRKDMTKLREVVEVCPHCMHENTYMLSDRDIQLLHGRVQCQGCGEKILLCGECTRGHCELQPHCFEFLEEKE